MLGVLANNRDVFGRGFLTTIELFGVSSVGCLLLGTLLCVLRVSPVPALRAVGAAYVSVLRNTPLTLVFAFVVFALPKVGLSLPFFASACTSLVVYTAAFVCEILRSGIATVPAGQAEAARALGMSFSQVLGLVVLPQALRAMVPPLASVLIAMLKNTTVAAGFSVLEAGAVTAYLSERGENQIAALVWITAGFLVLIAPLALVQRLFERGARP